MSTLAERLRGVIAPGPPKGGPHIDTGGGSQEQDPPYADNLQRRPGPVDPAEQLGGEWRDARGQRFLVIDRKYSPGYRHGQMTVADSLPPAEGIWPRLSLLAGPPGAVAWPAPGPGRMLFIDLETTGLAGGAGTYAFLVGCAWFDGGVFRIRQFFLSTFAAERVLLEAVAEAAEASGTVVTYNGKSFDVPLIDTRFQLHRLETPFAGMPHVDLLHPARRLWRSDEEEGGGGCRLSALEETLCGHTREGDVPGFEIPARYFHYVRSGDARGLEAVMEHNRLDLLSLALLTAHASQLLEDGPAAARTAREALGLGRLYERGGLIGEAHAAFERAADMPGADVQTRAEALRASALLSRRLRRYDAAAAAWRRILELRRCPPQSPVYRNALAAFLREATEALAVHHEHRLRDPRAARSFALESMKLPGSDARRQALQHRLARLDRKLGAAPPAAAPLF